MTIEVSDRTRNLPSFFLPHFTSLSPLFLFLLAFLYLQQSNINPRYVATVSPNEKSLFIIVVLLPLFWFDESQSTNKRVFYYCRSVQSSSDLFLEANQPHRSKNHSVLHSLLISNKPPPQTRPQTALIRSIFAMVFKQNNSFPKYAAVTLEKQSSNITIARMKFVFFFSALSISTPMYSLH